MAFPFYFAETFADPFNLPVIKRFVLARVCGYGVCFPRCGIALPSS
jgi:hypothetical protein